MNKIILAIFLCSLFVGTYSLSCFCNYETPKEERDCPKVECPQGLGPDACGCCDVCLKVAGEKCGGPWGAHGTCADGLKCQLEETSQFGLPEHADGKCVESTPKTT